VTHLIYISLVKIKAAKLYNCIIDKDNIISREGSVFAFASAD